MPLSRSLFTSSAVSLWEVIWAKNVYILNLLSELSSRNNKPNNIYAV